MIKWIIEILKRIFMQPQTTDRTTEDTNVREKKVVTRTDTVVPLYSTVGSYKYYYVELQIPYQKAGVNDYARDTFYQFHFSAFVMHIRPINYMEVDTSTGNIKTMGNSAMFSSVYYGTDTIQVWYYIYTTQAVYALPIEAFDVLYSTSLSNNTIWT